MPTGTFVYTGAGKKLNDGETDPCLINKTCRRLACDIQWCRELYPQSRSTLATLTHTRRSHMAAAPSYAFAAPLNPASFTCCFGCPPPPPPFHTWPRTLRAHTSSLIFPRFTVSKRNYQVHKCQNFIDKWENCCNSAKKEAAVCAAQGKPYTWTKG